MFPYRMARGPSFLLTSWLFTLFQTAVLAYNLPTNISNFIPSCAAQCFASFVRVSYGGSDCAHDRSLQCLCSQVGATGFTLGEGALQCIVAERSIGFCSSLDASDDVVYSAYNMCEDEPNAVTPTHKVITATLVMPTSGGIITFPPVTTTPVSTDMTETPTTSLTLTSFSTLPTTLVMETSSSPSVSTTTRSPSRIITRTSSRLTTTSHRTTHTTNSIESTTSMITLRPVTTSYTSTAEETSATPGAAAGGGKKDDNSLSKNQIAGISVGVLAAAGFAIAAILLARYYRKKKYPKIKTGFLPNRDTWGYKPTRSNSGGTNSWVAHQARRSLQPFPPPPAPAYNRSSHRPGTIGLAISPANSRVTSHTQQSTKSRRMSRLLPAKPVLPVLPLNITKRNSQPQPQDEWPVPNVHYGGPSRYSNPPQLPPVEITPAASVTSPTTRTKPTPPAPPKLLIPGSHVAETEAQTQQRETLESAMTEFEEDMRTSISPTQVWRPPPTTPISAKTFYVADQNGNWRLADPSTAAQLAQSQPPVPMPPPKDDAYVQPAVKEKGKGKEKAEDAGSVSPLSDEAPKGLLAPPAEIIPARSQSIQRPMGPRAQPTAATSSLPSQRRNSANRYSGRSLTRPRGSGTSDATTITTSSEGTPIDPSPAIEQFGSLSPVQESPSSGKGRSPVSYPKIPSRDPRSFAVTSPQEPRAAPPPTRPMVYYPPGQPSPTLGTTQPPAGFRMSAHWAPKPGRRSVANPGLDSTGSPTMRIVEPSPEPEDQSPPAPPPKPRAPPFYFAPPYPQPLNPRQTSQRQSGRPFPQQPYPQPPYPQDRYSQQQYQQQQYQQQQQQQPYFQQQYPQDQYPSQQYPQQRYSQQQRQQQQQRPQQQHQPYRPQQQYPQDQHAYEQHQAQRLSTHSQQQHQWHPLRASQQPDQTYRQPQASGSAAAGSSSLLAKRVGDDRAANMAIPTAASQPKWRRDNGSSQQAAGPPGDPAWVPTLTPSRRGDDLFLNVQ